ncbi:MAG: Lrp/AsnC family transcriptional regulator [Thermoplasmata archaeon]|nr:Lrp/AsnC family transcriptional regulator [Thermoplasmata archaeon]
MDELDIDIVRCMNENARKSFREMAKELKVSLSTISNRVHRLEEEGVLKGYLPVLDAQKIGYDLSAVIGIRISKGRLLDVQKEIAKDDRVYGVYDVTGEWDSFITVRFRNRVELDEFIKGLQKMQYIERTYTHVVLNTVKEERRVVV